MEGVEFFFNFFYYNTLKRLKFEKLHLIMSFDGLQYLHLLCGIFMSKVLKLIFFYY
jgi:hypothetical protein